MPGTMGQFWPVDVVEPMPAATVPLARPKLLDQLSEAFISRHYSPRTSQTCCHWVNHVP